MLSLEILKALAVRNTHLDVVTISEDKAFDKDGAEINLSQGLVATELARLQAEYDNQQYQRDRQYPSLEEQADMAYWDRKNGTTTLDDALDAVKAEYPKPTE
jgi:hypothetical protein